MVDLLKTTAKVKTGATSIRESFTIEFKKIKFNVYVLYNK